MISFQNVSLQRGQKVLLDQVKLTIPLGKKIGLIGVNGSGKTSLFLLLQSQLETQQGEINIPANCRIAHMEQEIPNDNILAIHYVLQGDREYWNLEEQLEIATQNEDGFAIAKIHHRLAEINGYGMKAKAAKILIGLGFSQLELEQPLLAFSGGWRMRLNLARVLIAPAEILLLDEPTNHLDLDAILWLEKWLQDSSQTLFLISHDREFLDNVTSHILQLENKKLELYTGNYSEFEKQKANKLALQQAAYEKQQQSRNHMQKFIDRFRSKPTKAKQVQSRIKMMEKMIIVEQLHQSSPFRFAFKPFQSPGNPLIRLNDANMGYHHATILKKVSIAINDGDRIGLLGPNGAGKSTLIKSIAKEMPILKGEILLNPKLKMGYFAQHQLEQLLPNKHALGHLIELDPTLSEQSARSFLGGFNFHGDDVFRLIHLFSGGEKARLVLALLMYQAPNLLLLDEPTNHLDIEVREALCLALQDYQGALIIVSHDRYLLKAVVNDLYLVADHKVERFAGDVDDYQRWLLNYQKSKNESANIKDQKKLAAASKVDVDQKMIKNLQFQIKNLENKHEKQITALQALDELLCQVHSQAESNHSKSMKLIQERKQLEKEIETIETQILEIMQQLQDLH